MTPSQDLAPEDPASAPPHDGRSRRRARTRAALLGAARELLAEGNSDADIRTITERAGVGFGSFFNHFPGGKEELWSQAVLEILDRHAAWTMAATSHSSDPVEVFALAFRLTGRLAIDRPDLVQPVVQRGLAMVFEQRTLRESARGVLVAGERSGDFVPMDAQLRLSTVGGALLAMIQLMLRDPTHRAEETVDDVAAALLRFLGVNDDRARAAVALPLPEAEPFTL